MDDKIVTFCDGLLQMLDHFIFKFGNRTAAGADQMVVMFALHEVLIAGLPVPKMDLMGNSRLGKKLQSPAHRRITDARMPGSEFPIQFLHAHVPLGGKEKIENDVALSRRPQPLPRDELPEGFLLYVPFHISLLIENDNQYTYDRGNCQGYFMKSP
jgi:hypothetical protein